MPAGIQVFAQDGSNKLQIDSNAYPNLHMRTKGSAATTTNYFLLSGANVSYVKVSLGSGFQQRPLVALRCTSLCSLGTVQQEADLSWSAYVYVRAEIGATFQWYAFDKVGAGELSNFGFQVFNASGVVIFDAARKPMKVVAAIATDGITGTTFSLTPGRVYAPMHNPAGRAVPVGPSAGVLLTWGASTNDGAIAVATFQVATISGAVTAANGPVSGVVLDVTYF